MNASVLVLTLNEASNIRACLKTLDWSDDVVVLDSLSTDATRQIAQECGARVVERRFDDWSTHQNWALRNIEFRHPWVLYLDADERCTPELRDEVIATLARTPPEAAFRIRRKDYYMGQWLRHAQLYPTWLIRLVRPSAVHYERLVNPIAVVEGLTGNLDAHILHYPFSHGVSHWIARHNRYSDLEAEEALRSDDAKAFRWQHVLARDPNIRRRALKHVFLRMPARPLVKFAYYAIVRRGFLDGRAGLRYAALQAIYEYLISVKTHELLRRRENLDV